MGTGPSVLGIFPRSASRCLMASQSCSGGLATDAETPRGNPRPPVVHATLTKDELGQGRLIIIGDIHGCSIELAELLQKCNFKEGTDVVVSVGDLVGKGYDSLKVLSEARRLGFRTTRGNWEEMALTALRLSRDGGADLEPKWAFLGDLSPEDEAYLNAMPFTLSIPSHNIVVVHAGLIPGVPLKQQRIANLTEMRHVGKVEAGNEEMGWRALPKKPRDAGTPWAQVWQGPEHVFFGHHATRRLQRCKFATGIDTGCVVGDKLTAAVLPSASELEESNWAPPSEGTTFESLGTELVSVPAHKDYCPKDGAE